PGGPAQGAGRVARPPGHRGRLPAAVRAVRELRADPPAAAVRRLLVHRPVEWRPPAVPPDRRRAARGGPGDVPDGGVTCASATGPTPAAVWPPCSVSTPAGPM